MYISMQVHVSNSHQLLDEALGDLKQAKVMVNRLNNKQLLFILVFVGLDSGNFHLFPLTQLGQFP